MRRTTVLLLAAALLVGGVSATPAAAESTLTEVTTFPGPIGHSGGLLLVAGDEGRFLLNNGMLIDSSGTTQARGHSVRAAWPRIHSRSDSRVALEGDHQLVVFDLSDASSTTHPKPEAHAFPDVEGVVSFKDTSLGRYYHFQSWDEERDPIELPGSSPVLDRGHALTIDSGGTWVTRLDTGESYRLAGSLSNRTTNEHGVNWTERLAGAPSSHRWCSAPWGSTQATCQPVNLAAESSNTATFAGTAALFDVTGGTVERITGSGASTIDRPQGLTVDQCLLDDDVLSCLTHDADGWHIWSLAADGSTSELDVPKVEWPIVGAALTPTGLYGSDRRSEFGMSEGAWRRDLADGSEQNLGPARAALAQGSRSLVGGGKVAYNWRLDDEPGQSLPLGSTIWELSGPYAVSGNRGYRSTTVFDVGGKVVYSNPKPARAIFGTNVLHDFSTVDIRTGEVVAHDEGGDVRLWGPWIMGPEWVLNRLTGVETSLSLPAERPDSYLLGDGVAVVQGWVDDLPTAWIFDLSKSVEGEPLEPSYSGHMRVLALDGDTIAWTRPPRSTSTPVDGDITISRLGFGGTSVPYFLGVADADTAVERWRPQFDFSADVAAGTIIIRNWNGEVVRTLPTPPSRGRIIRDLEWNRTDAAGRTVPDGPYTWELKVGDAQGRAAKASDAISELLQGTVLVGTGLISAPVPAPVFADSCGNHADTFTVGQPLGVTYLTNGMKRAAGTHKVTGPVTITAAAQPGFKLTGKTSWAFSPSPDTCPVRLPHIAIVDLSGTANDTYTLPALPPHATAWLVNNVKMPIGTHPGRGSVSFAMEVEEGYASAGMSTGFSDEVYPPSEPQPTGDVYTIEGTHRINGRDWRTSCEPYSQTKRCRTEIFATKIVERSGRFVVVNDWVFNNLTYLPLPRAAWKGNPVGGNGQVKAAVSWTAADGRKWRTECDTALTGRNGCRSYIRASQIRTVTTAAGRHYEWHETWVMNNMVRFS